MIIIICSPLDDKAVLKMSVVSHVRVVQILNVLSVEVSFFVRFFIL